MMNKEQLIKEFVNGAEQGKGSNLEIMGDKLYNYSTVIAIRKNGIIYLNAKKYSQTTSRNQNLIRRMAYQLVELGTEAEVLNVLKGGQK